MLTKLQLEKYSVFCEAEGQLLYHTASFTPQCLCQIIAPFSSGYSCWCVSPLLSSTFGNPRLQKASLLMRTLIPFRLLSMHLLYIVGFKIFFQFTFQCGQNHWLEQRWYWNIGLCRQRLKFIWLRDPPVSRGNDPQTVFFFFYNK